MRDGETEKNIIRLCTDRRIKWSFTDELRDLLFQNVV